MTSDNERLDIQIGKLSYFLAPSSSGMVVGLRKWSDGIPRHITIVMDPETEEIRNVHMKSRKDEEWRVEPAGLPAELASWIRRESHCLTTEDVNRIDQNSRCFSGWRAIVLFHLIESVVAPAFWILSRRVGVVQPVLFESKKETRILMRIFPELLVRHFRRLRPFQPAFESALRSTLPKILRLVAKVHMVELGNLSDGDVCFVIPKGGERPLVVVRSNQYFAIPLERILQELSSWYSKL